MGRRTYQWFAVRWPKRSGALADRLNRLPKYVVSSTLDQPTWNNSTVVAGNAVEEAARLRHELAGEIQVPASFELMRALLDNDLLDQLRLKVFPVVLGAGKRLFGSSASPKAMRLVDTRTIEGGVVVLTYEYASRT